MSFVIEATSRGGLGKSDAIKLRQKGSIPAVFYGQGQKNQHLVLNPKDLEKAVSSARGMNTLITLKVDGKSEFNVLLRDYQADPITRKFRHADLVHVDLTKKIEIAVPIHLEGKAAGVKEGGILEQVTRELLVLCFPNNIPNFISVDVSGLKIGQNLHLHDIKLPEGVEPHAKSDVTIASVFKPREEEIVAPAATTLAEPEVLTAKKEEGAAGAAPAAGEKGKEGAKAPAAEKKEKK